MPLKCDPIDMTNRKTTSKSAAIVVVDDDAGIRESLKDLLALEHWDCAVADTAEKGLALVRSLKSGLLVTDVPGLIGSENFAYDFPPPPRI